MTTPKIYPCAVRAANKIHSHRISTQLSIYDDIQSEIPLAEIEAILIEMRNDYLPDAENGSQYYKSIVVEIDALLAKLNT
jgi:hypothetical protein